MTDGFAHFLAERGLALVLVDRADTPDLYDIWLEHSAGVGYTFIRWIGDDKRGPTGDRLITAPQEERLDRWANRIAKWQQMGIDVFGYMHNPFEGHAPASVRRLTERLTQRVTLPTWPPQGEEAPSTQMALL